MSLWRLSTIQLSTPSIYNMNPYPTVIQSMRARVSQEAAILGEDEGGVVPNDGRPENVGVSADVTVGIVCDAFYPVLGPSHTAACGI